MKSTKRQSAEKRGRRAEIAAQILLTLKGYRVLASRVKTHVGEIDLVVLKGGTVVFVEVKARANSCTALGSITGQQQKRIARAAEGFLAHRPELRHYAVRYDAIFTCPGKLPQHVKDFWRP